jgi:inhibitor of the pro-sigma K processing machinery
MGLGLEMEIIIAYAFGLILLYIIGYAFYKVFSKPLKIIGILLFNGVVGGILLILINFVGSFFDFSLAINPITALTVGFLGIPGVILLIILNAIL